MSTVVDVMQQMQRQMNGPSMMYPDHLCPSVRILKRDVSRKTPVVSAPGIQSLPLNLCTTQANWTVRKLFLLRGFSSLASSLNQSRLSGSRMSMSRHYPR
ncbi:hypothetical protein RRG08_054596 [Elysia crispata]|uniref:Uncharacterized protein n=1 Tax=Elysia crispata TaxID=231223 RepID=A0AAE1B0Z1_9GAST|nr:hypothetical protein RRG08_054596 [Elysia crispata]